jgi:large subunit ribosomal protein L25
MEKFIPDENFSVRGARGKNMSTETKLIATPRSITGKQVSALRREGVLPAVVYGRHIDPQPISLNLRDATLSMRGLPSSALIQLEVGSDKHTVLVRDKQYHVLKGNLIHIDFQAVSMTEKLVTNVPVRVHGHAPVLDEYDAMVMTELSELEVEALPGDLPEYIDVDVSSIIELGDTITVAQLSLGDKVDVRHEEDEVIVIAISIAAAPEEEEEIEETELEPELITRGKVEDGEEEEEGDQE